VEISRRVSRMGRQNHRRVVWREVFEEAGRKEETEW